MLGSVRNDHDRVHRPTPCGSALREVGLRGQFLGRNLRWHSLDDRVRGGRLSQPERLVGLDRRFHRGHAGRLHGSNTRRTRHAPFNTEGRKDSGQVPVRVDRIRLGTATEQWRERRAEMFHRKHVVRRSLPLGERLQRGNQLLGSLKSIVGLLRQQLENDLFEFLRDVALQLTHRRRRGGLMFDQLLRTAPSLERNLPREHEVQHAAQAVEVRSRIDAMAVESLLRCHVVHRADLILG